MSSKRILTLLKCLILSAIVSGILLLFFSFLWYLFPSASFLGSVGKILMYTIGCFFAGFLFSRDATKRKYLSGMIPGICFSLLITILSVFSNQSIAFLFSSSFFTGILLCTLSGMLGGMLQK